MRRVLPYGLIAMGLVLGLGVLFFEPFQVGMVDQLVGWSFIAIAAGSITHLIARHSGPNERRPDF